MSNFRVQLDQQQTRPPGRSVELIFANVSEAARGFPKFFGVLAVFVIGLVVALAIGGFAYYQSFKDEPQYSLALLVDAAKRDDKAAIAQFIDIDAVVDDFVPQITDKAIELYGRGMPPAVIAKAQKLATPILPAVKERAKAELPRVIRVRTEKFGNVPFAAMVMGADQYLDITVTGDTALVKSKVPEHTFEVRMKRLGDRWQIVGVKEEQLATDIARTIGQQIIAIASKGLTRETADSLGVGNIADLLRQAEQLVR